MTLANRVMASAWRSISTKKMASNDGPVEPDHDQLQQAGTSMLKHSGIAGPVGTLRPVMTAETVVRQRISVPKLANN